MLPWPGGIWSNFLMIKFLLYLIWALSILLMAGLLIHLDDYLPARFAVHFDFSGKPNGWSERWPIIQMFAGVACFMNLLYFLGLIYINRISTSFINWPNKEYWFSTPELAREAYSRIRTSIT